MSAVEAYKLVVSCMTLLPSPSALWQYACPCRQSVCVRMQVCALARHLINDFTTLGSHPAGTHTGGPHAAQSAPIHFNTDEDAYIEEIADEGVDIGDVDAGDIDVGDVNVGVVGAEDVDIGDADVDVEEGPNDPKYTTPPSFMVNGSVIGPAESLRTLWPDLTIPPPTHPSLVRVVIPLDMRPEELGVMVSLQMLCSTD